MNPVQRLQYSFVEAFPERLEEGFLYISTEYATMSHLCACGCGTEVVTPLDPLDWRFIFDGKTVTVHPSIGNWSLPCRSHYIIRHNLIHWAGDWSDEEIAVGRARSLGAKRGTEPQKQFAPKPAPSVERSKPFLNKPRGAISALIAWLSRR